MAGIGSQWKAHPDGRAGVVLILDLGFGERGSIMDAPVDGFQAFVNVAAIQEFDELEQRYNFLEQQNTDTINAKAELLATITKINHTTKALFAETIANRGFIPPQHGQGHAGGSDMLGDGSKHLPGEPVGSPIRH